MQQRVALLLSLLAAINTTEVVEHINAYRQKHQVGDVTWDETVAKYSQDWAEYLAATGRFEHTTDYLYGENLAMTWGGVSHTEAVKIATDMWYSENAWYDYNNPGFSMETGHFTQLCWKGTQRIGAGVAKGGSGNLIIVMNFDPPGNWLGAFAENVFPPQLPSTPVASPPPPLEMPPPPTESPHMPSTPVASPPPPLEMPPPPTESSEMSHSLEEDSQPEDEMLQASLTAVAMRHITTVIGTWLFLVMFMR